MKKIIGLAIFWLLTGTATSQIFEVNSPTSEKLNEIISYSSDGNSYETYIFGDNGFGAVSFDRCANWQVLTVDSILKRSIKAAVRVHDSLLVIYGSDGLLKYSTNKGQSFIDLSITETEEVTGIALFADSLVVISHSTKGLTLWNFKTNEQRQISYAAQNFPFKVIGVGCTDPKIYVWGNIYADLGAAGTVIIGKLMHIDISDLTKWGSLAVADPYGQLLSANITQTARSVPAMSYTLRKPSSPFTAYEYWRGPSFFWTTINTGNINGISETQEIRSSLFNPGDVSRWQVGGNNNGEGFIVKNGSLLESLSYNLNRITTSGKLSFAIGAVNKIVMVGSQGKILTNDNNLSRVVTANPPVDTYIVGDTIVYLNDTAYIQVSGSEIDVTYKVMQERTNSLIYTFLGDGQPWSFSIPVYTPENYIIIASRGEDEIVLQDKAVVGMMIRAGYVVSDTTIVLGATASIRMSGSQMGVSYSLFYIKGMTEYSSTLNGTGGPLTFSLAPTETVVAQVRYQYKQFGQYGFQEGILGDVANINVINNVGIQEVNLDELSVYPNPCHDVAIVESAFSTEAILLDIQGRLLQKLRLNMGRNTISVSDLCPGNYFLRTEKNIFKIVKYY